MIKYCYILLAIALLICLMPMPYGYYILIRYISAIAFGVMAYDYYYQKQKEDKYTLLRVRVIELYTENRGWYGYRRINTLLRRENIIASEKVICRIMKEEQLVVKLKRTRKYNSY